jgi:hypothetical protein
VTVRLAPGARRTRYTGSGLVRALAALDDVEAPASKEAFAEKLSRWFDWTDAISLSAALSTPPPAPPAFPLSAAAAAAADERECARVRAALAKAVGVVPEDATADAAACRSHCQARQQAMDAAVGPLRRRLRASLSTASPAGARLAAVDAVMEQVVGAQERALLSTVPRRLERHVERLRLSHPDAWPALLRDDLRAVLLAELEHRWLPVEALLAALRRTPR